MMNGWGFGGGGGGFPGGHHHHGTVRRFEEIYHCYSVAYADKSDLEKGDKILLPPSAFDLLARLQVDYPMLFQLRADGSGADGRATHCGVLEFTAEEGCVYIPFWMMQNLLIEEGALLTVTNVSLPKATFCKLQPQSVDFLEISNPRAVLEHALRNYSCVTVGDIIQIPYNNKNFHFELKEVKPPPAACIIETDCQVDFDAPVGYVEPERPAKGGGADSQRSSACPSPATMSTASSVPPGSDAGGGDNEEAKKPAGIQIVDGKIVRPSDNDAAAAAGGDDDSKMLADRTGSTGVQRNAAIPEKAPEVGYWAIAAGDGARLDGKAPAALKDSTGNALDIRQLRAEAAAKRAAAAAAAQSSSSLTGTTSGKTLDGSTVATNAGDGGGGAATAAATSQQQPLVSKRRSRTAGKFSRLKHSSAAFEGSANQL